MSPDVARNMWNSIDANDFFCIPPVTSSYSAASVAHCSVICANSPQCQLFGVKTKQDSTGVTCLITGDPTIPSFTADADTWYVPRFMTDFK